MPLYEVTLSLTAYVRVDGGSEAEVAKLAQWAVANGPCLFVKMGEGRGRDPLCGEFCVKGMSTAVEKVKPWIGNRRVEGGKDDVADRD
jgi:hypothetical protein